MKIPLQPSFSCSLKDLIGGASVVAFNIGPSGEVYVLLAIEPLDYRTSGGLASYAKIRPDSPQRYRVLALRDGELELDLAIDGEQFNIHTIQPLGDDLLLVCSRSDYRGPADVDLNGRVYARDGSFLREFLLGDGVADVQTTRHGEIWVSYFDEGVFANNGAGASGLVAWSATGEKMYEYDAIGPVDTIVDCYALNVATDEDVWCYYYTDFPLVHMHKKRIVSAWTVPVAGSHAFAIAAGHALFAGGYDDRDSMQLVRLDPNGKSVLMSQFELCGNDGTVVKPECTAGRGSVLYVLSEAVLYKIDLNEILARSKKH